LLKICVFTYKSKKIFVSGSKCRSGSGSRSRDSRKCGSGIRDSKNADPKLLRIWILNPVTFIYFVFAYSGSPIWPAFNNQFSSFIRKTDVAGAWREKRGS